MKILFAICLLGKLIYSSKFCPMMICNETEEDEDLYYKTSCGHEFHLNCIHVWMKRESFCPMCRNLISNAEKELMEVQVEFTLQLLALVEEQDVSLDVKLTNVVKIPVMSEMMKTTRGRAISKLISQGADVNRTDDSGETALHYAVRTNDESLLKILLKNDANPNAIDTSGDTALHYAVRNANESLMKILLENEADPNMIDTRGETALHYTAKNVNESLMKILIENKADLNAIDNRSDTPLMAAAQSAQPKIVKLLLDAGANKDKTNNMNRNTALTYLQAKESSAHKLHGERHELNFPEEIEEVYSQTSEILNLESNFYGVFYDRTKSKWRARRYSKIEKKFIYSKGYECEETAAHASDFLVRNVERTLLVHGGYRSKMKSLEVNFPEVIQYLSEEELRVDLEGKKKKSKYVGVIYDENKKEWCAQRRSKRNEEPSISNGCYENEETAAHASDTLARLMENYSARDCHKLIPIKACIALIKNFSKNKFL